jgi:hypothetical protein
MSAGAITERQSLTGIGEEDALPALHSFTRGAIEASKNLAALVAGEGQSAFFQKRMEICVRDVRMAYHRVW